MSEQKKLLSFPAPPDGTVYVNDRVSFRTEGTERVICVHGVVFAHYGTGDRAAEAYTMVTLWESEYASQIEIARSFGYSARSLRNRSGLLRITDHGGQELKTKMSGLDNAAFGRHAVGCPPRREPSCE